MNKELKADRSIICFVLGGAVIGALAGYMVKKVGAQNILNLLKARKIISENVADTISEFASKSFGEESTEENLIL